MLVEGKTCPECGHEVEKDIVHAEEYCAKCGLVIDMPYHYVGGIKIE